MRNVRKMLVCSAWFLVVAANAALSWGGYVDYVQSLDPTGYYRLNETSLGTVYDSSGNGLNGYHDVPYDALSLSQTPGALDPYDDDSAIGGTQAVADFTGSTLWATGNNPFSLSLWVKPTSLGNWQTPVSYGDAVVGKALIVAESNANDGHLSIGKYGENVLDSSGVLTAGQWNHIGLTFDGTTMTLFLNKKLDNSASVALDVSTTPIGSLGGLIGSSQPYSGQLDEFAYWNGTVLSDAQMINLGNAAIPEPSTLILSVMGVVGLLAYAWRKRK